MKALLSLLILFSTLLFSEINCTDSHNIKRKNIESCLEQSDKALNTIYKNLIKSHQGESKPQNLLKNAQRAWVLTRNAHCTLLGLESSVSPGINMAICEIEMTQHRTKELEVLFEMNKKK